MGFTGKSKKLINVILVLLAFIVVFPVHAQAKTVIELNKSSATIYAKSSLQLKATVKGTSKKIKWFSSNKKIATVNSNGKVEAKKPGVVTITAKINKIRKKCRITVKANVNDISKIINKKLGSAITALGFKHVKNMDRKTTIGTGLFSYVNSIDMFYTANGRFSTKKTYIIGTSYYKNQTGKWCAQIRDKTLSAYGIKIGMTPYLSDKKLKKAGWRLCYDGINYGPNTPAVSRMYEKNGAIINIDFKNKKICGITYDWQLESEF